MAAQITDFIVYFEKTPEVRRAIIEKYFLIENADPKWKNYYDLALKRCLRSPGRHQTAKENMTPGQYKKLFMEVWETQYVDSLRYADPKWRNYKALIIASCKKSAYALDYANKNWREYKGLVLDCLERAYHSKAKHADYYFQHAASHLMSSWKES